MRRSSSGLSGAIPLLSVALLLAATVPARAQTVLNGSFEANTASGSEFNLTNAALTATVANVTGFGAADEIDLAFGTDLGIAPIFGDWKLQLHTNSLLQADAFSIALSGPLVPGQSYALNFYAARADIFPFDVEVGLSSNATDFGDLIFSGAPAPDGSWTGIGATFVAPSAGGFLTVRSGPSFENLVFVDNFTLAPVSAPEPGTLVLALAAGLPLLGGAARLRRRRPNR